MPNIFVNHDLALSEIKIYGFDMDYTLAIYKSPQYEKLVFGLLAKELIKKGYPEQILQFEYDHTFPTRGLWFDKLYGNFLKVESNGNILICVHGFRLLTSEQSSIFYPNNVQNFDADRIYILDTLFNLPGYTLYQINNSFS